MQLFPNMNLHPPLHEPSFLCSLSPHSWLHHQTTSLLPSFYSVFLRRKFLAPFSPHSQCSRKRSDPTFSGAFVPAHQAPPWHGLEGGPFSSPKWDTLSHLHPCPKSYEVRVGHHLGCHLWRWFRHDGPGDILLRWFSSPPLGVPQEADVCEHHTHQCYIL